MPLWGVIINKPVDVISGDIENNVSFDIHLEEKLLSNYITQQRALTKKFTKTLIKPWQETKKRVQLNETSIGNPHQKIQIHLLRTYAQFPKAKEFKQSILKIIQAFYPSDLDTSGYKHRHTLSYIFQTLNQYKMNSKTLFNKKRQWKPL